MPRNREMDASPVRIWRNGRRRFKETGLDLRAEMSRARPTREHYSFEPTTSKSPKFTLLCNFQLRRTLTSFSTSAGRTSMSDDFELVQS